MASLRIILEALLLRNGEGIIKNMGETNPPSGTDLTMYCCFSYCESKLNRYNDKMSTSRRWPRQSRKSQQRTIVTCSRASQLIPHPLRMAPLRLGHSRNGFEARRSCLPYIIMRNGGYDLLVSI